MSLHFKLIFEILGLHYCLIFLSAICGRAAELWFKEAKERLTSLNAIIYGSIIYANWWVDLSLFTSTAF